MAKAKSKSKSRPKPKPKARSAPDVARALDKAAKSRRPAKPPSSAKLAALAMAGDVEGLVVAIEPFADDVPSDTLMYKWLEVAADFGPTAKHRKAAEALSSDLMQCSTLRYDDDQMATGEAHFELGVAFLTAGEGLPRDLTRACDQLAMAKGRYYPWSIQGAEKLIAKTRKGFDSAARAAFDRIYDGTMPEASDEDHD